MDEGDYTEVSDVENEVEGIAGEENVGESGADNGEDIDEATIGVEDDEATILDESEGSDNDGNVDGDDI